MPHFVIECSENITILESPGFIMQELFDVAESTGLFKKGDIKLRIKTYKHFNNAGSNHDFIHVFGNIMEGRTADQKNDLSKKMVTKLCKMFPDVPIVSMNIRDFDKAGYFNRPMVE